MAVGAFSAFRAKHQERGEVSPQLLAAIVYATGGPCSICDLGAGLGRYVQALRECGYRARGFDAIEHVKKLSDLRVRFADLTKPQDFGTPWEWGVSIEVGEHIPMEDGDERPCDVFLDNLAKIASRGLVVSWARPGQRGFEHVNCRMPEWVAGQMALRGWELDGPKTIVARKIAGRGWNRKLLVFRPREMPPE